MHGRHIYTPYLLSQFLVALFLLALCVYSWRRRSVPGALPFAIGSLFAALWVASSFMEHAAADLDTKIFCIKLQASLQLPAVTALACFVLEYTWPGRWLTRRNLLLMSIAPLLFLLLLLTNDFHHLLWRRFAFDGAVMPLRSPGIWSFVVYALLLGLIEFIAFGWLFLYSPPPDGRLTVGLDGGYVRSCEGEDLKAGWFEVIAGKSVPWEGEAKCFSFVNT